MKNIITAILVFTAVASFAQAEASIKQIRALYADYTKHSPNWDNYEITWHTPGSYPSAIFYTDYAGKLLVKVEDANEFGSTATEYYFLHDTIQFIYSVTDQLTTHWSADTVTYEIVQLRYYFDEGEVFRALKKQYKGREAYDDRSTILQIPNETINHTIDDDAQWSYFSEQIKALRAMYVHLNAIF